MRIFKIIMIISSLLSAFTLIVIAALEDESILITIILSVISIVLLCSFALAVYFPLREYIQEEQMNILKWRYEKAIERLYLTSKAITEEIINKIVDEVMKKSNKNDDITN